MGTGVGADLAPGLTLWLHGFHGHALLGISSRSFINVQSISCPFITMVLSTSAGTRAGAAERRSR